MSPPKRIIVGHDLRTGGDAALRSAVTFANRSGAALRLVHVIEEPRFYEKISHPHDSEATLEEVAQKTGAKLQELSTSPDLASLKVEFEVRRGKPFVEIMLARRAWQGDLIVVGGAHPGGASLTGTTVERVVRRATVPVLVAKQSLSANPKTFLVPTDFSSCAKKAAEEAVQLAETFGARVLFLHAVDLYPVYAYAYGDDSTVSLPFPAPSPEEMEEEWKNFLSGLPLEKIQWEKRTEEGRAALTILQQAEQTQADAVVMGTHGRSGIAHILLGSVAEEVVRAASCPVLTVRPEEFQFEMG